MPVNSSFCPHDYTCIFNQMPPINMTVFNSKFLPDDYACIFIEYYSTALEEYFLNLTKRCSWSWSQTARWTGKWRRVSTRRWASRRRPWRTAPRFDFGFGALDMGILDIGIVDIGILNIVILQPHQGNGRRVPQQDHLRLPERDQAALYDALEHQRKRTKGQDSLNNLWVGAPSL